MKEYIGVMLAIGLTIGVVYLSAVAAISLYKMVCDLKKIEA